MKIALMSDIHGNLVALEAVLAALKREAPDQIICLGDVAASGPQPRQVIARLQTLDLAAVMGNTDRANTEMILPTTPGAELNEMLAGFEATVMANGHTHQQMIRRHQDRLLFNPGSVGLPYERTLDGQTRNPPWAEYGIIVCQGDALSLDLRRVPVDVEAVVEAARQSGMPHAEWWVSDWK